MTLINQDLELPVGLGMRMALDMKAMTKFASLSQEEKKNLINYVESSTTGEEARNRVSEVISNLHNGESLR